MSFFDSLYLNLPIWSQQILVSLYGWRWYHERYNRYFIELTTELVAHEKWSKMEFSNYQSSQLLKLFQIANKSPYYQNIYQKIGFNQNDNSFENLKKFPLLTKEALREKSEELLSQKPPRSTKIFKSSGTTGTPSRIYYTPEFHALEVAIPAVRNLSWAGCNYKQRRVMFGVRKVCHYDQDKPPFWRFSPSENMAYVSIYHMSAKNMPHYLQFLREYSPDMIMGYPNALNILAQYSLETNDLPLPAKAVFTMSETLTDIAKDAIEKVWHCKIYDRYGAVEGCVFASQCEYGNYHISPEVGIIAILDSNGNACAPGELGEVVCTGLHNFLQPLIRYKLGDMAKWALNQDCACGRNMPIIESIEGRFEDICTTIDGRKLLRFDTVFKGISNIKEAQVIQQDLELFDVNVVPTTGYNETDIKKIKENMKNHVGNVICNVIPVNEIERSKSGKFRAVICNLPK